MRAGQKAVDLDAPGGEDWPPAGGIAGDVVAAVGENDDRGGFIRGDLLGDILQGGVDIGGLAGGGEGGFERVGNGGGFDAAAEADGLRLVGEAGHAEVVFLASSARDLAARASSPARKP